ncbi:hypothetical protein SPRG_13011 [Saprolegnia parasitica CBS 223.65]|uniref:F-box domain-containing protein n=1 Tax=Saprolegnia parasitica (strain CBS 223.65) TaxID=695850 RepID=A0A067BTV9_SAPPC|nr:hypothetical protein SPRG_13011 [Saprolegnia parasitica CBS 223.65]KDO21673.1 hypothetical protein SPRG_13011 [Saprolegnia parasitica CBS 223.65]|eukprot:XP_012207597.1 hypothetical protein SPRG_13011 [Saprolegnia parasitica CBS 223.65]
MAATIERRLAPDVVQAIATFLSDADDLFALLTALPPCLLTDALTSLLALSATTPRRHLWPTTNGLLASLRDHMDRVQNVARCMVLYPIVTLHDLDDAWLVPLGPATSVRITIALPQHVAIAASLSPRINSIDLCFAHDVHLLDCSFSARDVEQLCTWLPTLPHLVRVRIGSTASMHSVLAAVLVSRATELELEMALGDPFASTMALTTWLERGDATALTITASVPLMCTNELLLALVSLRRLRSLRLEATSLSQQLCRLDHPWPTSLRSLHLAFGNTHNLCKLAHRLVTCPRLSSLTLSASRSTMLGPMHRVVCEALPALSRLRSLTLTSWHLTPSCMLSLVTEVVPRLHQLCLDDNDLMDDDAAVLASILSRGTSLCSLRLVRQGVSDTVALALAGALPMCHTLRQLYVGGNRIGSMGAIALVQARPASLRLLALNKNPLSSGGILDMAQAAARRQNWPLTMDLSSTLSLAADRTACRSIVHSLLLPPHIVVHL